MTFRAKFPGECPNCGNRIVEGEEIETAKVETAGTTQGYVHARCPAIPKEAPVCLSCWTIHVGECL